MIPKLVGRAALAGFALVAISLTGGLADASAAPTAPGISQAVAASTSSQGTERRGDIGDINCAQRTHMCDHRFPGDPDDRIYTNDTLNPYATP